MKFKPHSYQERAIKHIEDNDQSALFLDMGLGKTVSTLTALWNLKYDMIEDFKALIIAPKRVAQHTWTDEIEKWEHLEGLTVTSLLGTPKKRVDALKEDTDIYIINRELIPWLVNYLGKDWFFDVIIIDELTSFKNPSSARFKALRTVRPFFKRVIGLTGTPAPNGLLDLWAQMYLIDGGERLGRSMSVYKERFFVPGGRDPSRGIIFNWEIRDEDAKESIYSKISDISISMKAEDYLDMPEVMFNTIEVNMTPQQQKLYEDMERDFLFEVSNSDEVVFANNAAGVTNKLLQMSNGAVYDEDGKVHEIHNEKVTALEEIVENNAGKPILVFYSYKHDLERIKEAFPQAQEMVGEDIIKRWNNGEIPMLLAHPASAGHGLNLQYGGNIIVWFGLNWSLELYQQANARLYRQGQSESVVLHHILTKGTVEKRVLDTLQAKEQNQDDLMAAIKERMKKYKLLQQNG